MMARTEWEQWLRRWLVRHPLKSPPSELLREFPREVMAKIRTEISPAPVIRWSPRPRWTFALGWALATALAVALLARSGPLRVARQEGDSPELWDPLEQMEELPASQEPVSDDEILKELQLLDESELELA